MATYWNNGKIVSEDVFKKANPMFGVPQPAQTGPAQPSGKWVQNPAGVWGYESPGEQRREISPQEQQNWLSNYQAGYSNPPPGTVAPTGYMPQNTSTWAGSNIPGNQGYVAPQTQPAGLPAIQNPTTPLPSSNPSTPASDTGTGGATLNDLYSMFSQNMNQGQNTIFDRWKTRYGGNTGLASLPNRLQKRVGLWQNRWGT